jgi:hypothetical protein
MNINEEPIYLRTWFISLFFAFWLLIIPLIIGLVLLNERMNEVQQQLNNLEQKKEEITRLSHGKAGYVYIVSNLGAFGEEVFKIGMTRRLEPQERISELSGASVPFPFDVHSFIFSNDAPALEANLHKSLNDKRVNRVNLRKEFFKVSIGELEELVFSIQPTAEFTNTMLAEQYHQGLSINEVPDDIIDYLDNDLDEDEDAYESEAETKETA